MYEATSTNKIVYFDITCGIITLPFELEEKNMNFVALGETIVIESFPKKIGEDIIENGIFIGTRETSEVPLVATVVAVGSHAPQELLGKQVLMPSGGVMTNVPDPRVVKGEIKAVDGRKMCATNYKNITVVYE